MFDTDINLFLQSFQTSWLTALMTAISAFGSEMFLMAATGLILFVISFRKGSILFQIILWSFVLTTFCKEWLDPKPFFQS